MKTNSRLNKAPHPTMIVLASLVFASCTLGGITALGEPGPILPPLPEMAQVLWREGFNAGYSFRATNAQVTVGDRQYRESFSGYALECSGAATPFIVPGLDAGGRTNLMSGSGGALRFWVRPSWSSATAANAGVGPGACARLADLNANGLPSPVWSLQVVPDGSALSLVAQSEAGPVELLRAPIAWRAGVFHLVALNFGPQGTALLIDGRLAAEGLGTLALPPSLARLALGSTLTGVGAVQGDLEEAFSFGRPLAEEEVAFYYTALRRSVVCWQITSCSATGSPLAGQAATLDAASMDAAIAAGDPPPVPGGGGGGGGGGDNGTNSPPTYLMGLGLCLYAPIVTSNSITLNITNTPDSGWLTNAYDLFCTTNLAALPAPALCLTNWAWLARSTPGQTNFVVPNPGCSQCYFRLGTMQDGDNDGLTDAYELLVSHSNPHLADSSGDGMLDGWKVLWGLNPSVNNPLQSGLRCNFTYCLEGWLSGISGVRGETVGTDYEGNVTGN